MRKVLIFSLSILILLTCLPVIAAFIETDKGFPKQKSPIESTVSTQISKNNDKDLIITVTMELIKEDFCDEAIKAVLAIVKNNFEADSSAYNIAPTAKDSDELYKKVKKLYKKAETDLKYKGKSVFIPISSLSSGFTKTDKDYPYIKAVASPWDCFHKDFIYGKEYAVGVSLSGIDYLCKEGYSAEEALKWYLPEFDIK